MSVRQHSPQRRAAWLGRGLLLLGFGAGVVVIMMYLAGRFSEKVPISSSGETAHTAGIQGTVVPVRKVAREVRESAVGTIRAVYEIPIRSKLLARVVEVNIAAGQAVRTGDVLVQLDDTDLRAKLEQANAAVVSSEALRSQAASDQQRNASLLESKAISRQEYEKSETALRAAEAELERAQEAVKEMQATLDWATIRSPIDGTVVDKQVDAGEMVVPGQPLAKLFDPKRMQLVANVRESLTHQLRVGQDIDVRIEGLDKQCSGLVSEIVPEAQSASRAFQVKVTGPCPDGIFSGMFGRIFIPLGMEQILVVPRGAVRQVGQLELVHVVDRGQTYERAIRTGRLLGDVQDETGRVLPDQVEVLSGLREGEQIVVPATSSPAPSTASMSAPWPVASGEETSHD